ncbi:MAG TPA: hypothetical protein VJS68_04010, partial [Thermoplasmata archaeon]|nr:hypothetical protein [Thermoplasmata archaeon]
MLGPSRFIWRTIRQRKLRASKGQVSAIVTIFALLLLVSFIANFVLLQLPSQEQELEFEHVLQVENQLSRLQATILSQALNPAIPLPLASPVTLSAAPDPPFGVVATGSIQNEPITAQSTASYQLARVVPSPPNWENGSGCLGSSGGSCTGNKCQANNCTWNETFQNNATITIKIAGSLNLVWNITGSNDVINVGWSG